MNISILTGPHNLLLGDALHRPQNQIFPDRPRIQRRLLAHEGDQTPVAIHVQRRDVLAVHQDLPGRGIEKSLNQCDDRALATTTRPHERNVLPGLDAHAEIVNDDAALPGRVIETDVAEFDSTAASFFRNYGARRVPAVDVRPTVEEGLEVPGGVDRSAHSGRIRENHTGGLGAGDESREADEELEDGVFVRRDQGAAVPERQRGAEEGDGLGGGVQRRGLEDGVDRLLGLARQDGVVVFQNSSLHG